MLGYYKPTKKALKESIGELFNPVETSIYSAEYKGDGEYAVVGPDPFNKRSWYATVTVVDGRIVKVK